MGHNVDCIHKYSQLSLNGHLFKMDTWSDPYRF